MMWTSSSDHLLCLSDLPSEGASEAPLNGAAGDLLGRRDVLALRHH